MSNNILRTTRLVDNWVNLCTNCDQTVFVLSEKYSIHILVLLQTDYNVLFVVCEMLTYQQVYSHCLISKTERQTNRQADMQTSRHIDKQADKKGFEIIFHNFGLI